MAHVAKNDIHVRPAVAGASMTEGLLVRLVASGATDLPIAVPATASTHLNVYVAFFPPDDFDKPALTSMYTANWYNAMSVNGSFQDLTNVSQTLNFVSPSLTENPVIASGYKMQARRGGIYHVGSGVVVDAANIKVVGSLVKTAADNSGKWEYTATETDAIGKVVDYDASTGTYTFELGFDS